MFGERSSFSHSAITQRLKSSGLEVIAASRSGVVPPSMRLAILVAVVASPAPALNACRSLVASVPDNTC
jgi:hypothetical protein